MRDTPQEDKHIFSYKFGNSQARILTLKNGNSKNCFKKWEFPIFYVKNSKNLGIPMSSLPLQPKKCLILGDFPMKIVIKIFWIPMSSLRGVHLISRIAHSHTLKHTTQTHAMTIQTKNHIK